MAHQSSIVRLAASTAGLQRTDPFIKGRHVAGFSSAGANLYGVDQPSAQDATKYQLFKQQVTGNKAFELSSSATTPQNTTGGALSAANQLRVVAIVNGTNVGGTVLNRTRGDQDASSGNFVVGAGGGTLVGDTTMVFNAAVAANAITSQIKSSGANVKTLIVGDRMTIVEGSATDTVTVSAGATMNGTTAVAITHSPVANAYTTAATLTFVAATGKAIIINPATALQANGTLEVWVSAASDITTHTGGALTASREYDITVNEVMFADAAVDLARL